MCASIIIQRVSIWILLCLTVLQTHSFLIKRSPLELGYVTFPNEIATRRSLVIFNKTNTEMDMEKNSVDLSVPVRTHKISHTHEWIPGQIRHHSFIPAHLHHIYIPLIITRTVIVKPSESLYDYYPRHYGGFGLGSYSGGQGAGHGFQIIFNP